MSFSKANNNMTKVYLEFEGNIYYHKTIDSSIHILTQLLNTINCENNLNNKIIVGFDCEWNVRPMQSKVCLIQLCVESNECHLFHLSAMNYTIPPLLQSLLLHQNCLKVGLNIENDIWKLQRDYCLGFDQIISSQHKSVIDLSVLANRLLGKTNRWSLNGLSEFCFNKSINKSLRISDWAKSPLSCEQQKYAAIDAFASYELYFAVKAKALPLLK